MSTQKFFPHQLTENVKFLQKAAIIINDQVLILHRALDSKSRPDCWDLPGGNCEWPVQNQPSTANLHLEDIAREVEEETGLIVPASAFVFGQLVHLSSYFDSSKQIYTIITGWKVTADMLQKEQKDFAASRSVNAAFLKLNQIASSQSFPPIQLSSEHTEHAWIKLTDLANYDFGGEKGSFLVDIIEGSFSVALH